MNQTEQHSLLRPPASQLGLSVWCIVAAFGSYFCMYGFRKPFTAAGYEEFTLMGLSYKSVLVTAQVLGYMLSKFLGIRVVSEMPPARRAQTLLLFVAIAQAALLLFAVVPAPWNFLCLFVNGLPLGMVFGLVLGFLEGRRATEALTAGLCASFILADGVTKSVGAYLLALGVNQFWMPFAAGAVFAIPLLLCTWMLAMIPPPNAADIQHRNERAPMTYEDRRRLFLKYATGLSLLVGAYLLLTILRSVRADFAPEIWKGLGQTVPPSVFTRSEIYVMFGVVAINGLAVFIRDNRRAFAAAMWASVTGFALVGLALVGFSQTWVNGFQFMVLIGLGLYLPYVAVHTTIFERLLAMTGDKGNIGFLMYLADSFGYLGYVAVMLARGATQSNGNFLEFFLTLSLLVAVVSAALLIGCWIYFAAKTRKPAEQIEQIPA
ncbi:MAG: DUF5690 family protein [Acidobacteriota bacterium]|nr:DUF5690 family protein [Acidobacteriota bacterium]